MSNKTQNKEQRESSDSNQSLEDWDSAFIDVVDDKFVPESMDKNQDKNKDKNQDKTSVIDSFADKDKADDKPQEKTQDQPQKDVKPNPDLVSEKKAGKPKNTSSGTTNLGQAFIIALIFKLAFAAASFGFGSPWVLGFAMPLAVMGLYMLYGWMTVRNDTAERKISFGDSCYYLGFLFTIASIILALCGLGENFKIQDIAVRFGAAMLTTLLGMAVRVYYVTFAREQAVKLQERSRQLAQSANGKNKQTGADQAQNEENKTSDADQAHDKDDNQTYANQTQDAEATDDMSVIIQANCHNLALLNKTLMVSLHEFEQLRANINALNGRVTHDLQTNVENVRQTSDAIMANTQEALDKLMQKATSTFGDMTASMEKSAQDMLAQNAKANEALTKETAQKIQGLTEISATRIEEAGAQFAEKVKNEADVVHTSVKNLSTRLDKAFAQPEQRWESELDKASDSLVKAVEKFNHDIESLKLPSTYLDESAQTINDHVKDNCQNIKQATDRLTTQTENFSAAMQSLTSTIKRQPLMENHKPSVWKRLTGGLFKR